jgi:hypothetical protein
MQRLVFLVVTACALIPISTPPLSAQGRIPTLRGQVRDTAGQPIDGVQVLALSAGRTALTGQDGRFQMDTFPIGKERFLFRRLGFNRVEATVVISGHEQELAVRMTPLAQELAPIVVRGRRSGVFGVVIDPVEEPIVDVEVTVLGGAVAARTDSLGRFNLPSVPAGTYMMMVRKRGYFVVRQSVTLPVGESLDLTVLLGPVPSGLSNRTVSRLAGFGGILDMAWDAHQSRRMRCAGGNSVFVPREEIADAGGLRLDYALPRAPSALNRGFDPLELRGYNLFIDGRDATGWPLASISAADVEAVEVYRGSRRSAFTPTSIVPGSRTPTTPAFASSAVCPNGTVWVWLR